MRENTGFNPRSRTGNDHNRTKTRTNYERFQSTFPHGERRELLGIQHTTMSFNPRSRTGNDAADQNYAASNYSFNPRSRTGNDGSPSSPPPTLDHVSIHVPARGTTGTTLPLIPIGICCFNPRSRTGNDKFCRQYHQTSACFNPRSRTGNDPDDAFNQVKQMMFQSTFPHGERLCISG